MLSRGLAAIALVVAMASAARAQSADELSAQAAEAVGNKEFAAAAELFRQASQLEPKEAKHLCNAGMAYYSNAEYPLAHHYIERCLEIDPSRRKSTRDVTDFLRSQTSAESRLTLYTVVPMVDGAAHHTATVSCSYFADHGSLIGGATYLLPFGTYEFTVEADGYVTQTEKYELTSHAHTIDKVHLKEVTAPLDADPDVEGVRSEKPSAQPAPTSTPLVTRQADTGSRWARKGPWVAFGGSVAAAFLGYLALEEARDIRDREFGCDDRQLMTCDIEVPPERHDDVTRDIRRWEALEYGLYTVAAGSAALGLYLLLRDPEPAESRISVSPTRDGAMVFWRMAR